MDTGLVFANPKKEIVMGMKREFTCNGCQKIIINFPLNWFSLSQMQQDAQNTAKLQNDQCFCSLKCLLHWTQEAVKEEEKMKESARSMPPRARRMVSNNKILGDLYL